MDNQFAKDDVKALDKDFQRDNITFYLKTLMFRNCYPISFAKVKDCLTNNNFYDERKGSRDYKIIFISDFVCTDKCFAVLRCLPPELWERDCLVMWKSTINIQFFR